MATLLLKQAVNGVISNLGAGVHPTQGNSIYSLTVEGTSNIPEGLELLREGDDLIFSVKGEEVSRLTEFYSDEMVAQVSVNGSLDAATAEIGTSTLAEIEGGGVVWPESESLATWGEQESLFSPSNLAIGAAAAAGVAVAVDDDDSSAPPLNVTILGGTETPTNSDVTFTITFDQAVSDFTAAAIDVTGGTKGTFTQISETEYTLVVAPAEDSVADITVDIAEGAVRSRAGAPSEVAEQETQAVDTLVAAPIAELESAASGGFTNSSHVNVSGLEEGASWEYQLPGSSDWVAGSTNVFEIDDAVYADDTIKVRQTDAVGNVSEVTTLGGFTVDTTIEDPTIDIASDSALSSDRITNDENIQVGNIESGASWEYSTDGGSSWTDGSGSSFSLADGDYDTDDVQVRTTDAAGNQASASLAPATIDTVAAAPTAALEEAASGGYTSDATVTVGGFEEGASWEYQLPGASDWTAGSGSSFELGDDTYADNVIKVRQTDVAGNTSSETTLGGFTVDTTVEDPTIDIASDSALSSDRITNDDTIDVGNIESGASWEYSTDGGSSWTDGSGSSFSLADGDYDTDDVQVRTTDAAGNQASASLAPATIDTVAAAPTAALEVAASGGYTSDATVTVGGFEEGASWEYQLPGASDWTAGSGSSFELGDDTYADNVIKVRQTDVAGNTSSETTLGGFTVDTTVEDPTIDIASDSALSSDRITNDDTIDVGNIESGASWEYSTDGGSSWTDGTGSSFSLADGDYDTDDVQVRTTDAAGNQASASLAPATIDTVAAAPTAALEEAASGGYTSDATVTVGGFEEGASWEYQLPGASDWTAGSGSSFELGDDTYADNVIKVRQTDVAGNTSSETTLGGFTVDTTIEAPTIDLASDTGDLSSDRITNDENIQVGNIESGASWEYSTDGGSSWTEGSGSNFSLADGDYDTDDVQVRTTDAAGNQASASLAPATIDTVADDLTLTYANRDSGGSTSNATVNVDGIEAGASWEYQLSGMSGWATGSGSSFELNDDSYGEDVTVVQVRQTDVAGNQNSSAAELQFTVPLTIDTTAIAPTPLLGDDTGSSSDDRITNDDILSVSGLESGATWEFSVDSGSTWSSDIFSSNAFSVPDGEYVDDQIQVRQTDALGNVSAAGKLAAATIDTLAPNQPTVVELAGLVSGGATTDATVNVTLAESGGSWEYSTDQGSNWSTGAGSSFELPDGTYDSDDVQVRQIDVAGNEGTPTNLGAVTVESAGPIAVVFDYANGHSSSLDGTPTGSRIFSADESYEIYFIVESSWSGSLTDIAFSEQWSGTLNLGSDDKLILIGDSNGTVGPFVTASNVYYGSSAVTTATYGSFFVIGAGSRSGYVWGTSTEGFRPFFALATETIAGTGINGNGNIYRVFSWSTRGSALSLSLSSLTLGSAGNRAEMAYETSTLIINLGGVSYNWNGSQLVSTGLTPA